MKKEHVIGGIVIALIVGVAIGWAVKSPETVEAPKGKWEEAPPAGEPVVLKYGFDAAYPPFTTIDPAGAAVGFDVDVVNWIADKYGWTIEYTPWDWAAIVTALVAGDLDFIESGMTHTAARAEKVWYSIPYYVYYHHLLVTVEETRSMEEVLNSGETISCQLGSTADEWAEKLLDEGYNFDKLALDTYALAFEAVLDGRAIAVVSDTAFTGPYFVGDPEVAARFRDVGTIGGIATYAIATRPDDYWLRNRLNSALEELMASHEWDEFKAKWEV